MPLQALLFAFVHAQPAPLESRVRITVTSSVDGTGQPSWLVLPPGYDPDGPPVPLVVSLHTWSFDLEQRQLAFEQAAARRGWIYLFPNFRGPNHRPEGCGSAAARMDIVDAVDAVERHYRIDRSRVYLTGVSGGGHMTMLMAGRHPEIWAAASAWVGISDLAAWERTHHGDAYGRMLRDVCGGAPGDAAKIDEEYRQRSPIAWLTGAAHLPLDLNAGVHDGHQGSVPIRQTLDAFNVVARSQGEEGVTEEEIAQLSRVDGRLGSPRPTDTAEDATYGRAIHLRRESGRCRVTIFEGGHEGLAEAAFAWLERWRKGD